MEPLHEPREAYVGPGELAGKDPLPVTVTLRGHLEPLDGAFHWYGRIAADAEVAQRYRPGATVTLTTPYGAAAGRLSDVDPWGRFRIAGTGAPPF